MNTNPSNSNIMRRSLLVLFLFCFVSLAFAQKVEVSGVVGDEGNKALAEVIVKVTDGTKTYAFTTTDSKGEYHLSFDKKITADKTLSITFSHISFEKESLLLEQNSTKLRKDVVMQAKNVALKEVKVYAQPVHQSGDTLKYNLASFIGKGDVTLEDGIKRLPGIEVTKEGAIKYLGKGISNFYIEGMDMLGGKYNLATKNIPAQYATQVEVLRHHKDRKVDADTESDDVAINVKLSRKAKFKPFGQQEFGAGYRAEDILVALGLTEMMFTDKFQLLGSAKFSNDGDYGAYDIIDHYMGNSNVATAPSLLGRWQGGQPPLGDYQYQRNGYGSLNSIVKKDEDHTFRINADYSYERNHNEYSTQTLYFADGQNIDISESQHPFARIHKPSLSLRYVDNADQKYVREELKVKASFEDDENPMVYNGANFEQYRDATALYVTNDFDTTIKKEGTKYFVNSSIGFQRAPEVTMKMNGIVQRGQSTGVRTNHRTSITLNDNGRFKISLPLSLNANYDFLRTSLLGTTALDNQQGLRGWNVEPSANPSTEWNSANKKAHASFGVNVRWNKMHYNAMYGKEDTDYSKLFLDPHLRIRYTFSGTKELVINSALRHSSGDMLDLLISPIQTDYRNTTMASGIIGEAQNWTTSFDYKYQIPFSYFSMNVYGSWSQGKRNVLSSQMVDDGNVNVENIIKDSYNRRANGQIKLSKNYIPIKTKAELDASWRWSSSETMSQKKPVTTYSQGYSLTGKIVVSPVSWSEITGKVTYDKGYTRNNGVIHKAYDDISAMGSLALYPIKSLEIRATYDYAHALVAESKHKDASLLGASVQYKQKLATWKLSLNNLLDAKHYSYTSYTGPDRYIFDCSLLGRTAMLTCTLNIAK